MLCSMTGFARVEDTCEQGNVSWEIRSVNHRYLEITFRLPEEVRRIETQFRQFMQTKIARGKVDCVFRYQLTDVQSAALDLNEPLLESLIQKVLHVNSKLSEQAPVKAIDLLAWPGVVHSAESDLQSFHATCFELFKRATQQLVETRTTEGQRLETLLHDRCKVIESIIGKVRSRYPQVLQALKDKVQIRLEELSTEVDQNRLEQELVYLAQKLDIAEELDRLSSHLSELEITLQRKGPTGRRLDFLMQEFNREANTIASKSADIETTQAAVDLKVVIEQMREQVQNVE